MKKVIVTFAIAVAAVSANASYLYWAVTESDPGISSAIEWTKDWTKPGYDSATLYVYETDRGYTAASKVPSNDYDSWQEVIETKAGESGIVYADVSAYSTGYSFFIELRNSTPGSGSGAVAWSESMTYAQLSEQGVVYDNVLDIGDVAFADVWHGGSYKSAPEPTSAMLMLLGVAGLALRRKQRKA